MRFVNDRCDLVPFNLLTRWLFVSEMRLKSSVTWCSTFVTQRLNFHVDLPRFNSIGTMINALANNKFCADTLPDSCDVLFSLADKLTASRRLSRRSPRLDRRTMANGCSSSVVLQPIPRRKSHGFTAGTWSKIRQGIRFVVPDYNPPRIILE